MMHQRTVMTVPHSCYAKSNLSPPVPLRVALDKPFCDVSQATLDSCPVSCAPIFGAHHYPSVINMLYLHVCEACRSSLSPLPTVLPSISHFPLMSHTHPTSSSSNFKLIFDNALKAYKKRTKKDLLTHPLADRLEACDSASSILTVVQEQLQVLNESQRGNTKWLEPTVNVLHAFSGTLGEGVGSVCLRT